ncbi:MAG: hypothetical protein Cons2KO_05320 [Congregibacter sp.]
MIVATLFAISLALAGLIDAGHVHSNLDAGLECYSCHLSADAGASNTQREPVVSIGSAFAATAYLETADSQPVLSAYPRGPPLLS